MNDGMGYGHWYACHEKMQKHLKAKKQKQKHSAPVWIQCWIVVSCYAAVAALIDQHWTKALWCVWVGLCVGVAALRDWHRTFTCHDLNEICAWGFARIWAAIAGFRVQSANRYTTKPIEMLLWNKKTEQWMKKQLTINEQTKETLGPKP